MNHPDAQKWDAKYTADGQAWLGKRPRPLLLAHAHLLPAQGLALAAAAGVGTNALFLAARGLRVLALDISLVALRLAQARACSRGLQMATAVYDLAAPWFPPAVFDVILNFRFLERATFAAYREALKPGGLLFFETFVRAEGMQGPPYLLEPGELRAAFADFELIWAQEGPSAGPRSGPSRILAQLVARKPP